MAKQHLDEFSVQELANTAWAFAAVNRSEQSLFIALVGELERRMSELEPLGIANTAWAFVTVNQSDEKLFTALAREAL